MSVRGSQLEGGGGGGCLESALSGLASFMSELTEHQQQLNIPHTPCDNCQYFNHKSSCRELRNLKHVIPLLMISSITGVSLLSFSWCHTQRGDGDLCLRRHQPVTVQSGGQPANQETGDTGEGPLTPREGEELSGCLKLSSPLAHPPQGFRNQSFFSKAIKMKLEPGVNR